jgi:hypothetical protein
MPIFKSTYNILKKPDEDEVFDPNWMDSDKLILPKNKKWDYKRELKLEDVQIWEVIAENGSTGIYASYDPYAEFYLVVTGSDIRNQWVGHLDGIEYNYCDKFYETYYGKNALNDVILRMTQLGIPVNLHQAWVDEEDAWLYH